MHGLEKNPRNIDTFFARADTLRMGHNMHIYKERSRHEPRKNFFSQRVVIQWNALPEKVVSSNTMRLLKIEYDKCGEGGGVKISSHFYPDWPHTVCEATQVNIVCVVYQWTATYMVSKPETLR